MREELADLRATDLKNALASKARHYGLSETTAGVSAVPEGYFDDEIGPFAPIRFKWDGSQLLMAVQHIHLWPEDGDENAADHALRSLLRPLLAQYRSTLHSIEMDDWRTTSMDLALNLTIQVPLRARSVADVFTIGEDLLQLCEAFANRSIERETVGDLVRGGGAHPLIGQPEGNWLDVKGQEYDLTTLAGEISLAQSVARFCNAEDGGLIVIGAKAKKVPGGEVIRKISGVPVTPDTATRYQRIVDRRVYPPPLGMRIDIVVSETPELPLIVIDIPPQGEELKPFLVHGAIRADGEVEGVFISILQRRGEMSVPITAPMIHATLAAGRALLRGSWRVDAPIISNPED